MLFLMASIERVWRSRFALRFSLALELLSTCSLLLIFYLIDRYQNTLIGSDRLQEVAAELGTSYFGYVALGLALSELSHSNLGGVLSQFHEDKSLRILPYILSSRISLWKWAVAAGVGNILRAIFQAGLIFGLAVGIVGLDTSLEHPFAALAVVLLAFPSLFALSVICLVGALLIRRGDPVGFLLGILFDLCGGVYVPVQILPAAVRGVSQWIPLTPSLQAMHAIVYKGASLADVTAPLSRLLLLSLLYLPLAYLLQRWADHRARLHGFYHLS